MSRLDEPITFDVVPPVVPACIGSVVIRDGACAIGMHCSMRAGHAGPCQHEYTHHEDDHQLRLTLTWQYEHYLDSD